MINKWAAYGERPITELCLLLMTKKDLIDLVNGIKLTGNKKIEFNDGQEFEKLYIEAPLDKQIRRYYDKYINKIETTSGSKLVQDIFKIKSEKKDIYLISVTHDVKFPDSLKEYYINLDPNRFNRFGWLSYSFFREILEREKFTIEGKPPHIWVECKH